ncbi:Fungal specific transcription factor domain containing protein [Hyaloscypha variabilis]
MAESQNASASKRPLPPPNRRRDKPQLSCNVCRSRKLKCDREHPCGGCQRRGISDRCTYVTSNILNKSTRSHKSPSKATSNLQSRISPPGDLAASVAHANAEPEQTVLPEIHDYEPYDHSRFEKRPAFLPQYGNINFSNAGTRYVDSGHWTAILDKVVGINSASNHTIHDSPEQNNSSKIIYGSGKTDILFGTYLSLNSHQILAAIPFRETVDQLVAQFFSQGTLASVIIHNPTFLKQYHQFWATPKETSIIWVGLLFVMMCLGQLSQQQLAETDPESHQMIQKYRERIGQCLVLGEYTKCPPFTIETLLLLLNITYLGNGKSQMNSWVLLGTIVQLALRAGYHRDPSHFPEISPFDGEMRRRTWASVVQFDALLSTQFGIPGIIKDSLCDTAEPLNLLDEDLDENMTAPPMPRNDNLYTPTQFLLAKTKLARVQREIADLTESIKIPAYNEVMRLDTSLNNIYSSIPDGLKMLPRNHALVDTADNTIRRIDISILYQRAKCTLHHRYMLAGGRYIPYEYSRSACIEGALQILEYQHTLNLETASNRTLYQQRRKVSSFVNSCFYFAATLLCLVLKDGFNQISESNGANLHLKRKIVDSLDTSYRIWNLEKDSSIEVRKIVNALETVLRKGSERTLGDLVNGSMVEDGGSVFNDPGFGNLVSQAPSYLNFAQLEVSTRVETSSPRGSMPPNPMSVHLLMGLNDSAGVDYSGTNLPRQPSNLAATEEDLFDISMGFPRMFGFANDGVRTVFGGTRED